MQNKPVKVEIIGRNNNGTINSVSSNSISINSTFNVSKITTSDLFKMPYDSHDTKLIYGFSPKLNKNIFIYPISSITIDGQSVLEDSLNYIYSQDDGESWTIGRICDEDCNQFTFALGFDCICYANGLFYAIPTYDNETNMYAVSSDGSVWEERTFPSLVNGINRLRWVGSLDSNTILVLVDNSKFTDTKLYYSQDNGDTFTKIADLSGVLNRILFTDNEIYIYNQSDGNGNVYVSTNNGTTNFSFNLVSGLYGTINMAYGYVKYLDASNNIIEGYRTIALAMDSNNQFVLHVIGNNGAILRTFNSYIADASTRTSIPQNSLNITNNLVLLGVNGELEGRRSINGIIAFDLSSLASSSGTYLRPNIQTYNGYGAGAYIFHNSDYDRLITIKDSDIRVKDGVAEITSPISAFSGYINNPLQDMQLNQKNVYIGVDSNGNRQIYQSTTISKNNFYKSNNQSYQGILFDAISSANINSGNYYDYYATLFIYGTSIKELLILFDKENDVFPTRIIINGVEYSNASNMFYFDFGYGKYDNITIQFLELNKPNVQLRIGGLSTDVNCVFNRGNGLNSVTFTSVDESVPYYGIVSYSGSLEINDKEGILKSLSDFGLLPNIQINVYINNIKVKTFTANNDISYSDKDALVSIELLDEIQFLQQINTGIDLYYKDLNAVSLFNSLAAKFPYQITLTSSANSKLLKINISQIFIEKNTWWEVWNSFCSGTKTLLYKDINDIYRVGD